MKSMQVIVRATDNGSGGIDFEVDGVKAHKSRIALQKDSGSHEIDFKLKDETSRQLRFDVGDPIWVGEDCPCPPPQGLNSDQLSISRCSDNKLSTVDLNTGRGRELRYQLNLSGGDGSRFVCDPVITNGGGTTT